MPQQSLPDLARVIADGLKCTQPALCRALIRGLTGGAPLSVVGLAATLNLSSAALADALRAMPDIEYDPTGHIIGFGLTLVPTVHRFHIRDQSLYTWCAFDTLMYPALLAHRARVASKCPITTQAISFTVSSTGIDNLTPPTAVLSIVLPPPDQTTRCDRANFCAHGLFFSSPGAADQWHKHRPDAQILTLAEAHRLGHLVAAYQYHGATP